jgi:predicted Zn finger-like uncharacterized protein
MKIVCPNCNASGSIPEHVIPEDGHFLDCPRCKHGFTVMRPRATSESYLVDTCPACNYSTFGEERFETCPKCGVLIKTCLERQREEQRIVKEQVLLAKTYSHDDETAPPEETVSPVAEFIDSLHPVNLVGWGCGVAAIIIFCMGAWGVLDYDANALKEQISALQDEPVSTWYVFSRFGLIPWIKMLFGAATMVTVYFFLQRRVVALKLLTILVRMVMGFIPLYLLICFVSWVLQPISHSVSGYFVEIINIVFMVALFGIPLALLDRFLRDRRIVSIVKL